MACNCNKNILSTYAAASQTVASGSAISLTTNKILSGSSIEHSAGSNTITISEPGNYFVSFVGDVAAGSAGTLTLELENDSTTVPDAVTSLAVASTDVLRVSLNTIMRVRPSCCAVDNALSLSFVNTGVAAVYDNVTVVIFKL